MHALQSPLGRPAPVTMAVLGDSLAFGLGAGCAQKGLAHLLYSRVRTERPGSTYANFGVPHATMGDVLRVQIEPLHRANASLVLVIAGANDLRYTRDSSVIVRRLRKLLGGVHQAAPRAVVVAAGMPDIACTIAIAPVLKPAASRLCRRINEAMRAAIAELGDEFVDLYQFTNRPLRTDLPYLCDDGYHPADYGHAEIAQRAYPAIAHALVRI